MEFSMPRNVTISDSTFAHLQKYAEPFVDTPEDAIKKVLAIADGQSANIPPPPPLPAPLVDASVFNPLSPPDLTHTKVISIEFQGDLLPKSEATWNGLLNRAILAASKRLPTFADLKRVIHVNIVSGKKDDEGYRYLPDADVSVQGQDANAAWQCAFYVAAHLSIPLDVTFVWRPKEGAAYPGVTGRLFNK